MRIVGRKDEASIIARFGAGYIPEPMSGCWLWEKAHDPGGYGQIYVAPVVMSTHRVAWMIHRGPIPDCMRVLHQCDNPACCNPAHLFLGTQADNMADKNAKGRGAKGERQGNSKLTAIDVQVIRASKLNKRLLASIYGVHPMSISRIRSGRQWKHVN